MKTNTLAINIKPFILLAVVSGLLLSTFSFTQQATASGLTDVGVGCLELKRTLKFGSSDTDKRDANSDVTRLQVFLAQDADIYPEGLTTGYFGSLTETAVQRWQFKNNIVTSGTPETTGYGVVGPATRKAMKAGCGGTTDGGGGNDGGGSKGGGKPPKDTNTTSSPRVNLYFNETDKDAYHLKAPWTARLRWNGTDISYCTAYGAELAVKYGVGSGQNWGDQGQFAIEGFAEITAPQITSSTPQEFQLGIECFSKNGQESTKEALTLVVHPLVEADNQLHIETSPTSPDPLSILINEDTASSFLKTFSFEMDPAGSETDLLFGGLLVNLRTVGAETAQVVKAGSLVVHDNIDGFYWTDQVLGQAGSEEAALRLDFGIRTGGILLKDKTYTADVSLTFNPQEGNYPSGQTVEVWASPYWVNTYDAALKSVAFSSASFRIDDVTGSAASAVHTLNSDGAVVNMVDRSKKMEYLDNSTTEDDIATFGITFEATAIDQDVYIPKLAVENGSSDTEGVQFTILRDRREVATEQVTSALSSTADEDGGYYIVQEGTTEEFTLTVTHHPTEDGAYMVRMHTVGYSDSPVPPTDVRPTRNIETYQLLYTAYNSAYTGTVLGASTSNVEHTLTEILKSVDMIVSEIESRM